MDADPADDDRPNDAVPRAEAADEAEFFAVGDGSPHATAAAWRVHCIDPGGLRHPRRTRRRDQRVELVRRHGVTYRNPALLAKQIATLDDFWRSSDPRHRCSVVQHTDILGATAGTSSGEGTIRSLALKLL